MRIPLLDLELHKPSRGSIAWYGTVGALTAFEVIDWPLALVVAGSHFVADNSLSQTAEGIAEGTESAAG